MTQITRPAMSDDSGTFTDGTTLNKAFFDAIFDAIDALVHASGSPTTTPEDIIAEVVAARGSKASLDARLDVALEEDGTLKTQASLVTATQLAAAMGARQLCLNAELNEWENGAALAPNSFTLTGAAATIARTGSGEADTFSFLTGQYAAKITRAGTNWKLTQAVLDSSEFARFANIKGKKIGVGCMLKTALANNARIVVDDGVSTTASTFHAGDGVAAFHSALHTISNSATKLDVYVEGVGSNGDTYCGGFLFVFSEVAPTRFLPNRDSWENVNKFNRILYRTETEVIATARPIGRTYQEAGDHGNSAGVLTSLGVRTLPANSMADGSIVRYLSFGILAANANAKSIEFHFGSTSSVIYSGNGNNLHWRIEAEIVRVTQTTQRMIVTIIINGASQALYTTPAEDLATDISVQLKANGTGANDVVQKSMSEFRG